jgi:hypothetical protein
MAFPRIWLNVLLPFAVSTGGSGRGLTAFAGLSMRSRISGIQTENL